MFTDVGNAGSSICMATQKEKYEYNGKKCLCELHGALPPVVYNYVCGCRSKKEIWDMLNVKYQGSEKTRKIYVKRCLLELGVFRQKDGETMEHYYYCLNELIFKCSRYGVIRSTLKYNLTFLMGFKRNGEIVV